jgi:hypothetical protein
MQEERSKSGVSVYSFEDESKLSFKRDNLRYKTVAAHKLTERGMANTEIVDGVEKLTVKGAADLDLAEDIRRGYVSIGQVKDIVCSGE